MKKTLLILMTLGSTLTMGWSQTNNKKEEKQVTSKATDFLMLQLYYTNWAQRPDSINLKGFNRGFSFHFMVDFPFKNSNFSFAPGIGLGTYNYYFQDQRLIINEGAQNVEFRTLYKPEIDEYKKSKLGLVYAEAPLELRFFSDKYNRNKGVKIAAGVKIGYLLNSFTREKLAVGATTVDQKFATQAYFPTWTFSPTLRIGYGNFAIFGQYSLSQQFKAGLGPEMYPFTIGIAITGL